MPAGMVAAERIPVRPPGAALPHAAMASTLTELRAARRIASDLAYHAYSQLDGEGMHSLAMIEGLIAGAIAKIEAAVSA